MPEDAFVDVALSVLREVLVPPLVARRAAALLYEITVDNRLRIKVNPRAPVRAQAAFETDLCVFEACEADVSVPRVVFEFKKNVTTHDVLTYSAKARKHKQVYPYLRYGMVASSGKKVPGRVFRHNEALDFVMMAGGLESLEYRVLFRKLIMDEIEASRLMERIAFESLATRVFRMHPVTS